MIIDPMRTVFVCGIAVVYMVARHGIMFAGWGILCGLIGMMIYDLTISQFME